jgi:hypothetical protein
MRLDDNPAAYFCADSAIQRMRKYDAGTAE